MTRGLTGAVETAVDAEHVPFLIFVELEWPSGTLRMCNAFNTFPWNGFDWLGLGNLGRIDVIKEGAELQMYGIEMQLSGVNTQLAALALGDNYQGRAARLWFAPLGEQSVQSGTAQAGSSTTLTLAVGASAVDGAYNGRLLRLGDGRERRITGYNGGNKVATVERAWPTNALTKSSAIDHANWTKQNGITITANYGPGPDQSVKADRVQTDGISLARYFQQVNGYAGLTVCFSLKMRSLTGANQSVTVFLRETGFGTTYATAVVTVTPAWGLFSVSAAIPGGSAGVYALVYDSSASVVWDFLACEHQWNTGSTPLDFVETDSAAIALPDATTGYQVMGEYEVLADPVGPFKYRMDVGGLTRGANPTITITAESPMADYDRPRVRRWTDEDQRAVYPDDTFFSRVPSLQELEILF